MKIDFNDDDDVNENFSLDSFEVSSNYQVAIKNLISMEFCIERIIILITCDN